MGAVICEFTIYGRFWKENCLPDLNDLLHEASKHPLAYSRLKRDMQIIIINAIRRQLKGWKANGRVALNITWGEKRKPPYRDLDNIVGAGRKFINDALVATKTIVDDKPSYLGYGENRFEYTKEPFITVQIVRCKEWEH